MKLYGDDAWTSPEALGADPPDLAALRARRRPPTPIPVEHADLVPDLVMNVEPERLDLFGTLRRSPSPSSVHAGATQPAMTEQWRSRALCRHYPELSWFPVAGEDSGLALAVCGRCPVALECSAYAADAHEHHGIWGGHGRPPPTLGRWGPPGAGGAECAAHPDARSHNKATTWGSDSRKCWSSAGRPRRWASGAAVAESPVFPRVFGPYGG